MCLTYAGGIFIVEEEIGDTDLRMAYHDLLRYQEPRGCSIWATPNRQLVTTTSAGLCGVRSGDAAGIWPRFRAGRCARGRGVACRRGKLVDYPSQDPLKFSTNWSSWRLLSIRREETHRRRALWIMRQTRNKSHTWIQALSRVSTSWWTLLVLVNYFGF